MSLVDFGKNTLSYVIAFKYAYLSTEVTNKLVSSMVSQDPQTLVSQDTQTSEVLVSSLGPKKSFSQLKLGPARITIWAGWNTPFDSWKAYRKGLLDLVINAVRVQPIAVLFGLMAEFTFGLPYNKLLENPPPTLEYLKFIHRYIPQSFQSADSFSTAVSSDNETVEVSTTEDPAQSQTNLVIRSIQKDFAPESPFERVLKTHVESSDKLILTLNEKLLNELGRKSG